MNEHDEERLNRLEGQMAELMMKADRSKALLYDLEAHFARQDRLINRLLNLLGLTRAELEADTPSKPHKLLLLMRKALN